MNVTVAGKQVALTQNDFLSQGGEGVVYKKKGVAYKIYHDPAKMIAPGKIKELAVIASSNVLAPREVIYDSNSPIGFTMDYVSDTEFLCKLFTKAYRDRNNVTPQIINTLVKRMQDTIKLIHSKNVLLVDINELNFLVNKGLDTPYFIDVDSYRTQSYSATALMDSVRDRKVNGNNFTENSDWFSFGVVAFQLYIGCHPYKGRHPDFLPKDWMLAMDKGVSVFNPKSKLPPATQDMSVIPAGHRKWFESIFEKGDRSAPPEPDSVIVAQQKPAAKVIASNASFNVSIVQTVESEIKQVRFIDGIRYMLTKDAVYVEGNKYMSLVNAGNRVTRDFVPVQGASPVIAEHNVITNVVTVFTLRGEEVVKYASGGMFVSNRALYVVTKGSLVEIFFLNNTKVTPMLNIVANVFDNHTIFDGVVIQNMLGTCRAAIPFAAGRCGLVHLKELDKVRIIDAKYESKFLVVMAEKRGSFSRFVFQIEQSGLYTMRQEDNVALEDVNFTVKHSGVCIAQNDDKLEAFADNVKIKQFDSPLADGQTLCNDGAKTFVFGGKTLCSIASK